MKKTIDSLPAVGSNLRSERLERKLSLEELAERSGVSKAMLSQVESGKVNPTIATMWKIAQALNIDFNVLLRGEGEKIYKFTVSRKEDIVRLDTENSGVLIHVLSPVATANELELYMLTFQPGAFLDSKGHCAGSEEFLTVLSGRIKVTAGEKSAVLREGDVVNYQCDLRHRIENAGKTSAKLHMTVHFGK